VNEKQLRKFRNPVDTELPAPKLTKLKGHFWEAELRLGRSVFLSQNAMAFMGVGLP